jgi:hypothetical protein
MDFFLSFKSGRSLLKYNAHLSDKHVCFDTT